MDNYIEQIFKKKTSSKQKALVVLGVILVVTGLIATVKISFGIFFLILAGYILYMSYLNCSLEYEYLIVNGDIEISKVVAQKSRKKIFEFNSGDIVGIYKYDSKELENELSHKNNVSYKDFTSGEKDKCNMWYCFLLNYKNANLVVTLELNEKSYDHYEMVAKRKIK